MKMNQVLKTNAKIRTNDNGAFVALKAADFENKSAYTDYVYEIEKLHNRVFTFQLAYTKANRTAYLSQIQSICTNVYKLTGEEVDAVMDYFKTTADLSALTGNNTKTAETRQALKAAQEEIRAIKARKVTTDYTVEEKVRDLGRAETAKRSIVVHYTEQLQKQNSLPTFRKLFENKIGYVLNGQTDKITSAYETDDEKKARKRTEEVEKFTQRAADCNALGADIDAAALMRDGGIKALKDAVKAFYAEYTLREVERAKQTATETTAEQSAVA